MASQTVQPRLPAFLCVGAQKAGTTTLHALLGGHSEIFLPLCKEVHYFSVHYAKGLDWYSSCFRGAEDGLCIGEITPYYLFHPFAAERIVNDLGKIRIIILLRDPVERTISHYRHACRLGFEQLSLEQALAAESSRLDGANVILRRSDGLHKHHQECSYLSRSLYQVQVERYWKCFGRQNVLVVPSESLFDDPWKILQGIYRFLGLSIPPMPDISTLNTRKNKNHLESRTILCDRLLLKLRTELDGSYSFAIRELGWSRSLAWHWSV